MNNWYKILILIVLISGCVNIRENYPNVEYYNLKQINQNILNLPKINNTILLRKVVVNQSFDTPNIIINNDGAKVRKLFYHRWISDISTISTDFLNTRLNESGVLLKGLIRPASSILPDYIIEPSLIDMTAYKTDTGKVHNNYVSLGLKVDVNKRMPDNKLEMIFSKLYHQKLSVTRKEISYIPEAYSILFSNIADSLISDLSYIINK